MTKQPQQADNVIHEDQLLNFLVNALTGAFGISIAENGKIDPEDIYEVLVGATADGTSISTLCERSEDSYSGLKSAKPAVVSTSRFCPSLIV